MRRQSNPEPLFSNNTLILLGGSLIALFTLVGVLNNPGELIRDDVRLGPAIAAGKILLPLFLTIGMLVVLSNLKKCKRCGKIMFWKKGNH